MCKKINICRASLQQLQRRVIGYKNAFVQDSFWAIALFCVRISLVSSQPCGVGNVGYCQATKLAKSSRVQSIQIYMPPYTTHGK